MNDPVPALPVTAAGAPQTRSLTPLTIIVGLIVLIGFGWLCAYMVYKGTSMTPGQQFQWDHLVVIFNSVQTMAAAALGVLLGTTVQQARVETAQAKAETAQANAAANAGQALKAGAIESLVATLSAPGAAPQPEADAAANAALLGAIRAIVRR